MPSSFRKSCAFFDIDGTLLESFIIQSFPRYLTENGFVEPRYQNEIDRIVNHYLSGEVTYREAAEAIPNLYALALKWKHKNDVKHWAKEFIQAYLPEHIFPYSKQLVHGVGKLVDFKIAISGSPIEVVEELKYLGFDRVYGSIFEENQDVYTGRVMANLILGEEKTRFVEKICEELDLDLSKSVAFCDTDQDEPLLSMVGLPIAVNPNKRLKEICALNGWKFFEKEELDNIENFYTSSKTTSQPLNAPYWKSY